MKTPKTQAKEKSTLDTQNKNEKLPYNPNITEHDKEILSQDNIHGDGGDDQQLRDRETKVDFAGEDLDIPGRNQAKKTKTWLRDEENQLFSQGGDTKDNLEEDNLRI